MLFKILLLIHLLVDFYLQNDKKVEKKESQKFTLKTLHKNELLRHTLVYVCISSAIFIVFSSNQIIDYIIVIGTFFAHGIIDMFKIKMKSKYPSKGSHLFVLDQVIHIGILIFLADFIANNFNLVLINSLENQYVDYLLAMILLAKTANIVFGIMFDNFKPDEEQVLEDTKDLDNGHKNAGAIIGIMERFLVMICLLSGNFSTIGFVIGAKSVARFNKLSKTQFGEYFLLGTLYSVLFTMAVYYIIFVL